MPHLSELQQRAVTAARARLQGKPWFSGVCLDNMPSDNEIREDFEGAVTQLAIDTAYWDAPKHGLGRND
jgi:hypothetical protein